MVEMNETANILNNATERSLIILDEIGRGTSTFDGLSIAWSIAEFLHDRTKARTLFATHYHELTELEMTRPGVKNYNVAVREWNEQIIFLRKIVRGGADKSYGIQVARLAGLPPEVIARAKEVLSNLEDSELNADGKPKLAEKPPVYSAAEAEEVRRARGADRGAPAIVIVLAGSPRFVVHWWMRVGKRPPTHVSPVSLHQPAQAGRGARLAGPVPPSTPHFSFRPSHSVNCFAMRRGERCKRRKSPGCEP